MTQAQQLQRYLENPRELVHAKLLSASRDGDAEVIDMEVDVDLPQRPLYAVKSKERVRVTFPPGGGMPEAFALRKGFPFVPHTILGETPYPRQLCLYERSWADEEPNWAPKPFVERIRRWFSGTADGTLHRPDQPLEPIMQYSPLRITLPRLKPAGVRMVQVDRLFIFQAQKNYWVGYRERPQGADREIHPIPVLVVRCSPLPHGVLSRLPRTLGELEKLLVNLGGSLTDAISGEIRHLQNELAGMQQQPLLLVVELPKVREEGGDVESLEHRGFFLSDKVGELFKTSTEQVKEGGLWVPKTRMPLFEDQRELEKVSLLPLSIRWHLSPNFAADMNGHAHLPLKAIAIGVGSLGSQVVNNLYRGGFGDWVFVDNDEVEPHNPARHLLASNAVGQNKAHALSHEMQLVFPDRPAPACLACDYPALGNKDLAAAMSKADLILDLSASVVVERHLSGDGRSGARRITAFLNQRGDESVLLAEDGKRRICLFWLEAEYLRKVAFDAALRGHYDNVELVAHRYGNGCRDISATVPQDGVALHAALLSRQIRKAAVDEGALVMVNRWSPDTGSVHAIQVSVTSPREIKAGGWSLLIHPSAIEDLVLVRTKGLPKETGGVLLGVVDRPGRALAILGMLPAPPDSEAWPTSFIRGSNGLAHEVDKVARSTLGNVGYVGEWHATPKASTRLRVCRISTRWRSALRMRMQTGCRRSCSSSPDGTRACWFSPPRMKR
ncbi:MAG: ThiF family adenylyltransferase [Verrucomicrobiota bacterium]